MILVLLLSIDVFSLPGLPSLFALPYFWLCGLREYRLPHPASVLWHIDFRNAGISLDYEESHRINHYLYSLLPHI